MEYMTGSRGTGWQHNAFVLYILSFRAVPWETVRRLLLETRRKKEDRRREREREVEREGRERDRERDRQIDTE